MQMEPGGVPAGKGTGDGMRMAALLNAEQNTGGLSVPAMTIIAMFLLMLPYLIKRYTGKSVTDLVRFSAILDALEKGADKLRSLVGLGKKTGGRKQAEGKQPGGQNPEKTKRSIAEKNQADRVKQEYRERSQAKHRAGNQKNDYLQALARILTFARKKRLFVMVPGNVQQNGKTSELAAILVTRSRIIGISAYSFDGKIVCRKDNGSWSQETENGTKQIGSLNREAAAQDRILRSALKTHALGEIPCETVILFVSSQVELAGEKPDNVYDLEAFFRAVETDKDLSGGAIDPKVTGKKVAALKAGKHS